MLSLYGSIRSHAIEGEAVVCVDLMSDNVVIANTNPLLAACASDRQLTRLILVDRAVELAADIHSVVRHSPVDWIEADHALGCVEPLRES